ncbi:hypothetical protein [Kaarinaea lacus]
MSKAENLLIVVIVSGVFIPLMVYVAHLVQVYGAGTNVLTIAFTEQVSLVALVVVPLLILRLLNLRTCKV